ncbi:hypothetical protein HPO96_07840 [Kribbella sandramycini]|uniref:Tetratricopeptide repeat protein n=1 Tax=Kribbella sandramycini TaxID=60450 RepID=A0A7Y4KYG5_9ACTN|nr:hypothetical protein [Kribbella sandramycini]MBB6570025.1 hypothetical protein [Kribbella sandramycini]NOL40151.1 hypothetical protein [Kribbella sandramycini]
MVQVEVSAVVAAAEQLTLAGQWGVARSLLAATQPLDPAEARSVALALAEVSVDEDFARQTQTGAPALAALGRALELLPDTTIRWDAELLHLRSDYAPALFGGAAELGPALVARAVTLRDTAPDDGRAGMAAFYAGVIADNLLRDADLAFAQYTEALKRGESAPHDLVVSLALRHLGDHAHTSGDLQLARAQWERSTELRQKVGHLLGTLAQQTLLCVLLKDEGNIQGSQALAAEVHRWAGQAGLPFIEKQTAEMLA